MRSLAPISGRCAKEVRPCILTAPLLHSLGPTVEGFATAPPRWSVKVLDWEPSLHAFKGPYSLNKMPQALNKSSLSAVKKASCMIQSIPVYTLSRGKARSRRAILEYSSLSFTASSPHLAGASNLALLVDDTGPVKALNCRASHPSWLANRFRAIVKSKGYPCTRTGCTLKGKPQGGMKHA
jgi:hypothetical protein